MFRNRDAQFQREKQSREAMHARTQFLLEEQRKQKEKAKIEEEKTRQMEQAKIEEEKRRKIELDRIEQEKRRKIELERIEQERRKLELERIEQEKRRKIELEVRKDIGIQNVITMQPPPSPKPLAPPAKPIILSPPSGPMISNINNRPIIMPITGSPVSIRNNSPINNGKINNNPSIKSTFQSVPTQPLNQSQNQLLNEIKKLQDIVNMNIKNISETTNQTNVILSEIKELETEVNNNINIVDNIPRATNISDRLEQLEKSIKNRIKSNTIIELLTNRIHFILGNIHKKIIEIKNSDKGILELLPNLIVNIIEFIINLTIYVLPILIVGTILIYVLFSESEYAIAFREWIKNLFNFTQPVSNTA